MLKNKLEALLFSSGRRMSIEELSKLVNASIDQVQNALEELKREYNEKNSSTMLLDESNFWKLTVREQFLPLVRNIVSETELSKTIMETLAVIAFKYPIKQSDLIKIRTNKAYDHLAQLEEMGYITRQKHGRTNLIKLTQKFFEYFDLPEEKLKDNFQDFHSIAKAIEQKEKEIESFREEQKRKAMGEKHKEEKIKEQIESLDGQEVKESEKSKIKEYEERLGDLEVVDEPSDEELERDRIRIEELQRKEKSIAGEKEEEKDEIISKGSGIKADEKMERIIDDKVQRILHPPKEEYEEDKKGDTKSEKEKLVKNGEGPRDLLEASIEEEQKQKNKGNR